MSNDEIRAAEREFHLSLNDKFLSWEGGAAKRRHFLLPKNHIRIVTAIDRTDIGKYQLFGNTSKAYINKKGEKYGMLYYSLSICRVETDMFVSTVDQYFESFKVIKTELFSFYGTMSNNIADLEKDIKRMHAGNPPFFVEPIEQFTANDGQVWSKWKDLWIPPNEVENMLRQTLIWYQSLKSFQYLCIKEISKIIEKLKSSYEQRD